MRHYRLLAHRLRLLWREVRRSLWRHIVVVGLVLAFYLAVTGAGIRHAIESFTLHVVGLTIFVALCALVGLLLGILARAAFLIYRRLAIRLRAGQRL